MSDQRGIRDNMDKAMREIPFQSNNARALQFQHWFSNCSPASAVSLVFASALVVGLAFFPIAGWLDEHAGTWIKLPSINYRAWPFVLLAIAISPVAETLIYQWVIFRLAFLSAFVRRRSWIAAWLSAAIFGGQHFYSAGYIVLSFAVGLVFAYAFLLSGTFKRGCWVVAGAHCALNIVALAIKW